MLEMHKPINSPISKSVEIVKTRMKPKCLSIWEWINKLWHITTIEYHSVSNSLRNMNESQKHAEQKTPDTRDHILCDFIHKHFNKQNKSMLVDTGKGLPQDQGGGGS